MLLLAVGLDVQKIFRAVWDTAVISIGYRERGKVDGSKEIHIIWSIQVTVFHNGPWVSTGHPVR